jgi:formamidopyrimidine-DNA glycosylase
MPELPEVELARRNLLKWLRRGPVLRTEAEHSRAFRGAEHAQFLALKGKVAAIDRRGKYLLLRFADGRGLLAHLGMTGRFVRRPEGAQVPYSRARFVLEGGQVVHFADPRRFGRLEVAPADRLLDLPAVSQLGPDPLVDGLTPASLAKAVGGSSQALKVALMDQGRLAGLGNIHAAEALYRAKLHPARRPRSLTAPEWTRLSRGIHASLEFALSAQEGEEIQYVEEPGAENPFLIYGRAGERCRRCRTVVRSMIQGGRTTHFCPTCQPRSGKR